MMLKRIALAALLALSASASHGQDRYPNRPVKIIVPTPAGGPVDVVARLTAQYLSGTIGQSVVVDNRPGAGNTLGSKEAARAEPDGYSLLYSSVSGLILSPLIQKDPGYDPITSFAPIAPVGTGTTILAVHPSFPAKTVQELVAYAKANPGKVNFSSGGVGVLPHMIGEMFKSRAGIDIVHVPYRGGGPSIQDVVAGNIQMTFEGTGVLLPLVRAGKLRMLATVSPKRLPEMPDVPTMEEAGYPGFVSQSWTGLLAPANTSPDIVNRLNAQINDALKDKAFVESLAKLGADPLGGSPQEFAALIKADIGRWQPLVKALNLKTE